MQDIIINYNGVQIKCLLHNFNGRCFIITPDGILGPDDTFFSVLTGEAISPPEYICIIKKLS